MNKDQMESAKADFRARFFELERQKKIEAMRISESVQPLNNEEIQLCQKLNSEENKVSTSPMVECLDSSSKKQSDSGDNVQSVSDNKPFLANSNDGFNRQEAQTSQENRDGANENLADSTSELTIEVSESDASALTGSQNPFMSIKAQSFMPTAFVPSPNKTSAGITFNPSPATPMKIQNFGQVNSSQQFVGMPFKSMSVREITTQKTENL